MLVLICIWRWQRATVVVAGADAVSVGVVTVTVCGNRQWEEELFVLLYYAGQARDKKTNHMALQCSVQQCTQHFLVEDGAGRAGWTLEVTNHKSSQ